MKKILFLSIAFVTFCGSGIFTHFYQRDDQYSLRYNLWKIGLHPMPSDIIRSLMSDPQRNELIRGKTKEEIKRMFPGFHEEAANEYQARYEKWDIKGREHLWYGESEVIIFLENGIATDLSLMKG
jgi:hypothetical protein